MSPEAIAKKNARNAQWKRDNPEKVRAQSALYALRHPDKLKERSLRRVYTDAQRARNAAKYAANRESEIAKVLAWKKRNPAIVNANNARRRARRKNAEGAFTNEEWFSLCAKYDGKCLRCGEVKPMSIDHVMPLSLGGSNYISNIQPLCKSCNSWKHDRHIDYRGM